MFRYEQQAMPLSDYKLILYFHTITSSPILAFYRSFSPSCLICRYSFNPLASFTL